MLGDCPSWEVHSYTLSHISCKTILNIHSSSHFNFHKENTHYIIHLFMISTTAGLLSVLQALSLAGASSRPQRGLQGGVPVTMETEGVFLWAVARDILTSILHFNITHSVPSLSVFFLSRRPRLKRRKKHSSSSFPSFPSWHLRPNLHLDPALPRPGGGIEATPCSAYKYNEGFDVLFLMTFLFHKSAFSRALLAVVERRC